MRSASSSLMAFDHAPMVPDSGMVKRTRHSLELRRKESFPRLQVQRRYLVQDRIGWLRSDAASRSVALRAYDPCRAAMARAIQAFESLFLLHLGGTNGGTQIVRIEKSRLCAA